MDYTCKDCLCSKCIHRGICLIVCDEEDAFGVDNCTHFIGKEPTNEEL